MAIELKSEPDRQQPDIEEIYEQLTKELDWRGPSGRVLGHICFHRPTALRLHEWLKDQLKK